MSALAIVSTDTRSYETMVRFPCTAPSIGSLTKFRWFLSGRMLALASAPPLTLTAPYALTSGQGLLVGSIFGVASADAAISTEVEALTEGVFTLTKATGAAWTVGALIYWDNAARNCTTTVATNKLIGVAQAAAASGDTTGNVRLNGAFIS
jgi:predicted RecA/RadA family phage recombinase